jgi:non-ribosomal peptide synthetase component F
MLLLSVYYILLHKLTGSSDIIIGTDVLGRTHPSLKDVVGTFINILPLRIAVPEDKRCDEFLSDVKNCVLESFDNQDFQYDQMIGLTGAAEDGADANPLVQVHLAFSNTIEEYNDFEKFEIVPVLNRRNERKDYEFKLEAAGRKDRIIIDFICDAEKFDDDTAVLLMEYYQHILAAVTGNRETLIGDITLEAGTGYSACTVNDELLLIN